MVRGEGRALHAAAREAKAAGSLVLAFPRTGPLEPASVCGRAAAPRAADLLSPSMPYKSGARPSACNGVVRGSLAGRRP